VSGSTTVPFLPILGLDAQPVAVAASSGPEADAGEGRERLQSTGDDGLLSGRWWDRSTQLSAVSRETQRTLRDPHI